MLDEIEKNRGFNNKGFVEKRLGGYKQKGRLKNLSDGLLLLNLVSDCTTGDLCKKALPTTAEIQTQVFGCFCFKYPLILLKYPFNPPWIPD